MHLSAIRGAAIVGATLFLASAACTPTAPEPETVEYKLATIQRGTYVRPDDALVGDFASALDKLEARCTESRATLGGYAITGNRMLKDRGVIDETLLSVLVHLRGSLADGVPRMSCKEILALYITLRLN